MEKLKNGYMLRSQLFAEGGAGGSAGAAGGDGGTAAEGANAGAQEQGTGKRQKRNPLADVQYGIQDAGEGAPVAGEQKEQGAEQPAEESFDELIKGKYKQDFERRVQGIIADRLKNSRGAQERLDSINPILAMLAGKYGVDASDPGKMDLKALQEAIENDDDLYREAALQNGRDVETEKQIQQLKRQRDQLQAQERQRYEQSQTEQHFQRMVQQGEQLKQLYPGFDLMAELQNPAFMRLTSPGAGVDVKTAYEVIHKDEIMQQGMAYAAQQGAQRVARAVQSQQSRPTEPGMGGRTPSGVKQDPAALKKQDFQEILRRAKDGERIKF